jgi:hypothetical protein
LAQQSAFTPQCAKQEERKEARFAKNAPLSIINPSSSARENMRKFVIFFTPQFPFNSPAKKVNHLKGSWTIETQHRKKSLVKKKVSFVICYLHV